MRTIERLTRSGDVLTIEVTHVDPANYRKRMPAMLMPLAAHHSVPVNFDQSREVSIAGVITEIRWINPHSRFRLDVKQVDGSVQEWLVEMGAINTMKRGGFQTERFAVGDPVTIIGNPGRRDRVVLLRTVVLPDGTRLSP